MEHFDTEKAARVWQRVQNREPLAPLREDPEPLLGALQELAGFYSALGNLLSGKGRMQAHRLRQSVLENGASIRGICALLGRQLSAPAPSVPVREPARRLAEKCCHRERWLAEECRRRSFDPGWGPLCARLASQAEDRWEGALALLGALGK